MACPESVVGALLHARKSADAAQLPVRVELFPTAGEYLVGIGLMADVPDHLVVRRVIDVMERYGEFHGSETRCEVSRIHAEFRYHEVSEFCSERFQFGDGESAQVFRRVYVVEVFIARLYHERSVRIGVQRYPIITISEKNRIFVSYNI